MISIKIELADMPYFNNTKYNTKLTTLILPQQSFNLSILLKLSDDVQNLKTDFNLILFVTSSSLKNYSIFSGCKLLHHFIDIRLSHFLWSVCFILRSRDLDNIICFLYLFSKGASHYQVFRGNLTTINSPLCLK